MKVGIFAPLLSEYSTPAFLRKAATAAEELGFNSIWVPEHVLLFDEHRSRYPYSRDGRVPGGREGGILEPFNLLSFIAAATTRIRLGTGICLVPQRNPVYTAKAVATVDYLSNGRLDFGVGIGWLAEEFDALGVPWQRRAQRTREYLNVMRTLWSDPVSSYDNEFYHLPASRQYPKPVQQPYPPIHFGGESDAALRRVADLGQGWFAAGLNPEEVQARKATLGRFLGEQQRSLEDVSITVVLAGLKPNRELLEGYYHAGVDQLVLGGFGRSADAYLASLEELAERVVEPAAHLLAKG